MRNTSEATSPYASESWRYLEAGLSVIPCHPRAKVPGHWRDGEWDEMFRWTEYANRQPTEAEVGTWEQWPQGPGLCLLMGGAGRLVGIDIDTDAPEVVAALERELAGLLIARRRGRKGYCAFVVADPDFKLSVTRWNIGKDRVVDLLHTGRQVVVPPSIHPDTHEPYVWLTQTKAYDVAELPPCPADLCDRIDRALAPFQTHEDRKIVAQQREREAREPGENDTEFRKVNDLALGKLPSWVPDLIPGEHLQQTFGGYRARPFWRGVTDAYKCSIHVDGIRDFAEDKPYTPLDLVAVCRRCTIAEAMDWLCPRVGFKREPIITPETLARFGEAFMQFATHEKLAPAPAPKAVSLLDAGPMVSEPVKVAELPASMTRGMPDELLTPPGVLTDAMHWMLATARMPQPEMALQATLAFGSLVCGQMYSGPTRVRSNLYAIGIARTGFGKGHPQECVKRLLAHAGLGHALGGSSMASGTAMLSQLAHTNGHTLYVIDEIDGVVKAALNERSGAHIQEVAELLMKLYSASTDPLFKGKDYADRKIRGTDTIAYPSLTLLGYTTIDKFYETLSGRDVASGFVNRLCILQAPTTRPTVNESPADIDDVPRAVVEWAKKARNPKGKDETDALAGSGSTPIRVPYSCKRAEDLMRKFSDEVDSRRDAMHSDGSGLDDALVRWVENAHKIALICAVAKNPKEPKIDTECVEFAVAYIRHSGEALLADIKSQVSESDFDASVQKVHAYLLKRGKVGASKRDFSDNCRVFRKLTPQEFDAVLRRLVENGVVKSWIPDGKRVSRWFAVDPDADE